ncbi:tetratricopeptide repeat protein [Piscinibacter sp. XHJ-5]|uniref:tetratricopeptide repeat protein n=1 Tax=Piscinibacter sp. XHJ-5 TaxID=3037797 RepID=UPI0024535420|nr:tetratricopeptide repeat protein [Piscinibacter sp. XHJ-5]
MRSVDIASRVGLALLAAGLAGCATVSEPLKSLQQAVVAPLASAIAPATAASTAASVASPPPMKAEPSTPVSPAVQRAYDEARRSLRAGRVDEAEKAFRALAQANPELGGPHANLGIIYRQSGKLPEAVAELERAVQANPREPAYFNQLGVTHRQNGQFTKAREAYEQAIALDANHAAAHLNLGILHDLYLGDARRALELYDRYLALSPGGDAVVTKWVAEIKNRKPQQAMLVRKEKE